MLAFCAALSVSSATAQSVRGTILGTVIDASGAAIKGSKVTVLHSATGLTRAELTSAAGEYTIPQLPVGNYVLTVEYPGCKRTEISKLELRNDDKLRVDVTLSLGQTSETISVEKTVPVINTDSSTVGNVVDNKKVTELSLNGRNFLQLNLLAPGANQGVKGSQNQTQGGAISMNGAREQSNNFLLDGMDNNDLAINQYAVAISTEAIQEFKVRGSTFSAEFGRSPGAQVNVATKAGTNAVHGVLYEYLRNGRLDAKNFFDRPGPRPGFKSNQFGASIGGPIVKDKTFYFANFEGNRIRQGVTNVGAVPTAAMQGGDFSALPVTIYDPTSLALVNGVPQRTPFAGLRGALSDSQRSRNFFRQWALHLQPHQDRRLQSVHHPYRSPLQRGASKPRRNSRHRCQGEYRLQRGRGQSESLFAGSQNHQGLPLQEVRQSWKGRHK